MRNLKKFSRLALGAALPVLALVATPASATLLRFDLVGTGGAAIGFYDYWNTDSDPATAYAGSVSPNPTLVPISGGAPVVPISFFITDTPGFFAGFTATNAADIAYSLTSNLGGLQLTDHYAPGGPKDVLFLDGLQLFSGTITNPTFLTGTFNLVDDLNSANTYTLTVAQAAVPEASAWMMMLAGLGMVGAFLRRRVGAGRQSAVAA